MILPPPPPPLCNQLITPNDDPHPTRPSPTHSSETISQQVASEENGYLRRRLEAIERTTLKLNLGGASDDIQVLKERLEVESQEVQRLRETVDVLQGEKLSISEVTKEGGGGVRWLTLRRRCSFYARAGVFN